MNEMFSRSFAYFVAVIASITFSLSVVAEEGKKIDREQIEGLIAKLASPNKDPEKDPAHLLNQRNRPSRQLPKDYDQRAQKAVEDAERDLTSLGTDAFPLLIEHANDERYSMTVAYSAYVSITVGDVCESIISRQVDSYGVGYKMRQGADGQFHTQFDYFARYYTAKAQRKAALQKWWSENRTKSLKQMQIEALQARIAFERTHGFPDQEKEEIFLTPLVKKLDEMTK